MYCEKCKRQSPDNFTNCAYCGKKLNNSSAHNKNKKSAVQGFAFINKKSTLVSLIAVVAVISLVSICFGIATGKKPQSCVRNMVKAISENDEKLYFSLFDDEFLSYKKECIYFTDDELLKGITEPLYETDEFYKNECGDGYKIKCRFNGVVRSDEKELKKINTYLATMYGYKKSASDAVFMDFSVIVKGKKGKYESVYREFCCIKIGGKWYKSPEID